MSELHFRELTNKEMINVINSVDYCRLAVTEKEQPYVIPMYFSYEILEKKMVFTMRNWQYGMKMESMKANDKVALEFDVESTTGIYSVIVFGKAVVVNDRIIEIQTKEMTGRKYPRKRETEF